MNEKQYEKLEFQLRSLSLKYPEVSYIINETIKLVKIKQQIMKEATRLAGQGIKLAGYSAAKFKKKAKEVTETLNRPQMTRTEFMRLFNITEHQYRNIRAILPNFGIEIVKRVEDAKTFKELEEIKIKKICGNIAHDLRGDDEYFGETYGLKWHNKTSWKRWEEVGTPELRKRAKKAGLTDEQIDWWLMNYPPKT
ncbi:hypothetical protein KAU55_00470 [Candidatus Bathyarchaeota archaeon]|nr:hypothetical protein [Candidatus Bathyarchaeota archaeon]